MTSHELQQIKRLQRELHTLTEVAKTLTYPLPFNELLQAIMDKIIGALIPAEIGVVMLMDSTNGLFRPAAAFGYNLDILRKIGLRQGESITGKVYNLEKIQLLASADEVAQAMDDISPANRKILALSLGSDALPLCTVASPITVGDQKYGVLVLETLSGQELFKPEDLPFVQTLADLIAFAIDRERLRTKADAIREAEESERVRSELMATLSHELRLPLTAIKGYASALLLEEIEWSAEKQDDFLHQIEQECDNMQVILTDILDSSLTDVKQLSIEPQPLRLGKMIRELAEDMQRRTNKHNLIVDLPPDFPIINADPQWTRQIIRNILDNAIKYSPTGGLIVIRGEIREADIVVSISDQGIGISPEDLIPLFEKYQRINTRGSYQIPGMGLGLPIARTLVEAHGGRIWAESKIAQGTTLSFSLPYKEEMNETKAERQYV